MLFGKTKQMKLQKTTAALIALSAFAGVAQAQSSVTLYGIADAGILYNNNNGGHSQVSLSTANSSRFGLKGTEDLGGGLSAIFTLENGYTISSGALGQGGLLFGRKAFVGLSSTTWGTLTAGRQYSASNDQTSQFASGADWAASGLSFGTRAADVDNVDTSNRIANAIKYQSPSFNGLNFTALYSLGGQAGDFTKNSVWDLAAGYSNGPIKLGIGYMFTKDPYYATFGNQGNSSTSTTGTNNNMPSRIFGGYASAGSQSILTAGGSYALGPATIALLYSNTQFSNLGSVGLPTVTSSKIPGYTGGSATFNSGELNVKYQLTPALMLAAAYIYTHNSGAGEFGSAHYNQVNLGTVYALSKRTSLYATGFFESAAGTDSFGKPAVANFTGSTSSSTSNAVAAIVGITHRF